MGALHPQNPKKDQLLEDDKTAQSSINPYAEITVKSVETTASKQSFFVN